MKLLLKLVKRIYNRLLKIGKKEIIWILIISFICSAAFTAYNTIASSHIKFLTVTLNYADAKKGLNPGGSRYNISDILSDEVLNRAIEISGDTSLSAEMLRKRMFVDSKMPLSAIEKTTEAIASGSTYNYNPTEFDVYYSQKKKLGKNNTVKLIHALAEAYNEYFLNKYSDKNTILEFDGIEEFDGYDYIEIHQILSDKINSMITYLGSHQEENTAFRSGETGYSFENLINMLINLRDKDLEKLEAYIIQNKISNDKAEFIRKQNYLINKESLQYNISMQSSDIIKSALDIYDAHLTGIAFIPSVDGNDEYYMSRTKTGLDNLAMRSYNEGITATDLKKSIDEHQYLVDKFSDKSVTEGDAQTAETMIIDLCGHLEKISEVAIKTDSEYISDKTNDYLTFSLPQDRLNIPIVGLVKNFVAAFVVIFAGAKLCGFAVVYFKKKQGLIEKKLHLDDEDE